MSKCIAIFFDGTRRRATDRTPTNIVRLMSSVRHYDPLGRAQVAIYAPGVGSGSGNTVIGRGLDRAIGGALGWGLNEVLTRVYRDLVLAYEPGDRIMVFGYSRGAFAARAFVGLVRMAGILVRRNLRQIPRALDLYLNSAGPETAAARDFRARYAPYTATSPAEMAARRAQSGDESILLEILFLGLIDTVQAMFLTRFRLVREVLNTQGNFQDFSLDPMVLHARHAMALDEDLRIYSPTPWQAPPGETLAPRILQRWFAGNHGVLGGAGENAELGAIPLHWLALGAEGQGLSLNWSDFDALSPRLDFRAPLRRAPRTARFRGTVLAPWLRLRAGPQSLDDLSLAALDRLHDDPQYRPRALTPDLRAQVHSLSPDALDTLRQRRAAEDGGFTHSTDSTDRPGKS